MNKNDSGLYDDIVSRYYGESKKWPQPIQNARVITICGSMRFKEEMKKQEIELTAKGYIVLMPIINDDKVTEEDLQICRAAHTQKIRMSDEIFVININGYIGPHTCSEIELASNMQKRIHFLENADNESR